MPSSIPYTPPRAAQPEGRTGRRLPRLAGLLLLLACGIAAAASPGRRPNIVVLLADDLGFADIGAFGSEIRTPNLDALARSGVRFPNFYTHATCSPTRAMLLSGVDTHRNGLGNMAEWTAPNQRGLPGYEGYLNGRVATLPQLLKQAGYHTYMVGKWHLGMQPDQIPAARGFERDFSLLDGAGSYWDMTNLTAAAPQSVFTEDGRYLTRLPPDYYATRTYTDKLIGYIDAHRGDGKPFFAYVAHQAPHDPYHLPRDWRSRHEGEYDIGWDAIRKARLQRQIELGIVPPGVSLAARLGFVPDAAQVPMATRRALGRKMELYAGMVENLDHHVGRLVEHLKSIGEYDNTLFIVLGDNGAEGSDVFAMITGTPGTPNQAFAATSWPKRQPDDWGEPGSFVTYGPMWAQASVTPFSHYKGLLSEGGLRNALIVSGPPLKRAAGTINHGLMHVADIMPTLLAVAGTRYPRNLPDGQAPPPLLGKPWTAVLAGRAESPRTPRDALAWELFGNRAVRQGDWKARWLYKPFGKADWELFDVTADPGETRDLAAARPDKLRELVKAWDAYAKANGVVLPSRSVFEARGDAAAPGPAADPDFPPLMRMRQFIPPKEMLAEPKS